MKNRKILSTLLLLVCFLVGNSVDLDAQRRGTKKRTRDTEEDTRRSRRSDDDYNVNTWKDNLYYEVHFGNINFFGNQFFISGKPTVGYSLNNWLSGNLSLKGAYLYQNNPTGIENDHLFDWGVAPAVRLKFLENFYFHAEYSYNSNNTNLFLNGERVKIKKWSPFIGGGYLSGVGPNKFGMQVLFVVDETIKDQAILTNIVEFWFGFYKNF